MGNVQRGDFCQAQGYKRPSLTVDKQRARVYPVHVRYTHPRVSEKVLKKLQKALANAISL